MDETVKKQLGRRIKDKREKLGISQTELAKSVHKSSPAYIAFIESGERNVSAMDLMLIAKNLGTTVADLVGEKKQKQSKSVQPLEVMQSLRADKELPPADRKKIEEYYLLLKSKNDNQQ